MIVTTRVNSNIVFDRLSAFLPPIELSIAEQHGTRNSVSLTTDLNIRITTNATEGAIPMEVKQTFAKFLTNMGVLKEYIYCMLTSDNMGSNSRLRKDQLLSHAFSWSQSTRGHTGWYRIHNVWLEHIADQA